MARKKKAAAPPARVRRTFKSPIEIMLRNGVVEAAKPRDVCLFDYSTSVGDASAIFHEGEFQFVNGPDDEETWGDAETESGCLWSLYGEVRIESYRVDFLLQIRGGCIAIECDGHEWHEKTKQQAAYDRSRDRELLALGIRTIRFTGSEIHHSIDRCVADVYRIANLIHDAATARSDAFNAWHSEVRIARARAYWAAIGGDCRFGGDGALRGVLSGVI